MRQIALGKCAKRHKGLFALVDDDVFDALDIYSWHAWYSPNTKTYYARRTIHRGRKTETVFMHNQVLQAPEGFTVDHINRDTLDNRSENLRVASKYEQSWNRRPRQGASGYKGVHKDQRSGKWCARATVKGKRQSLGQFMCEKEAALAYDAAVRLSQGRFAVLNFPDEKYVAPSSIDLYYAKRPKKSASSQYKGVCYLKSDRKWKASVTIEGKSRHVGYYATEVEAARAYDTAVKSLSSSGYTYLNFPGGETHEVD